MVECFDGDCKIPGNSMKKELDIQDIYITMHKDLRNEIEKYDEINSFINEAIRSHLQFMRLSRGY
jgi:hypothetical protein